MVSSIWHYETNYIQMKISIINGSPRKNGATAKMLHKIESSLNIRKDVSTVFYNLSDIDMHFCRGCEKCYALGHCVINNDNLRAIVQSIKQADGIIIGTPTHGSNVSAILKNFMDRGHFILEQSLYGKKCLAVTSYEIADGIAAKKVLNKFFIVSGGTVIDSILVKTGFDQNPLNPKVVRRLKASAEKLHKSVIDNKRKKIFEYIFNDIIVVGIIWKSFFKKNRDQFTGVIEKYKQANIHNHLTNNL